MKKWSLCQELNSHVRSVEALGRSKLVAHLMSPPTHNADTVPGVALHPPRNPRIVCKKESAHTGTAHTLHTKFRSGTKVQPPLSWLAYTLAQLTAVTVRLISAVPGVPLFECLPSVRFRVLKRLILRAPRKSAVLWLGDPLRFATVTDLHPTPIMAHLEFCGIEQEVLDRLCGRSWGICLECHLRWVMRQGHIHLGNRTRYRGRSRFEG